MTKMGGKGKGAVMMIFFPPSGQDGRKPRNAGTLFPRSLPISHEFFPLTRNIFYSISNSEHKIDMLSGEMSTVVLSTSR